MNGIKASLVKEDKLQEEMDAYKQMNDKRVADIIEELRQMKTPPAGAKLAVEAVVACLQNKMKLTWDDCKKEMQKGGFVQSVLNFKPEGITEKLHHDITTNYIQNEAWDLKKIARASGAAGPLAEWVESLVERFDIETFSDFSAK